EPSWIQKKYEQALRFSLKHPVAPISAGIASFVIAAMVLFTLPSTFIPRMDVGALNLRVEFAPGTTLTQADRKLSEIAAKAKISPDVVSVFASASSANGAVRTGSINIQLTPRDKRHSSDYDVQQKLRPYFAEVPDVRVSFQNFQGPGRGADIDFQIGGENSAEVVATAEKIAAAIRSKIPEATEVRTSASLKRPELQITPRADEAARLGVSSASIATALRLATSGDVARNNAKFTVEDRQVPIRVQLIDSARADIDVVRGLRVQTATGGSVRLDSVADVRFGVGVAEIERRDRQRTVSIYANLRGGQAGPVFAAIQQLPEVKNLPHGVRLLLGEQTEAMAESTAAFLSTLGWGLLLVYLVLVLLFKDFFQPLTIMTGLPLCAAGAVIGLVVTGQPVSLFVFIGIIMLVGIVTKNSILLVDFAVEQMRTGVPLKEALLDAGIKRARPILMTTLAMSAGMIPVAAGMTADGAVRQGMGVAVIGGLLFSTLLSLLFVPAAAVWVDRLERFVLKTIFRQNAPVHRPAAPAPAE
ncbi:MAG: efflux RND transporter permease subunit, partial [Parvularculaceae bacterium]|nr:efflux RND transporter permease subunit [Parvularculaceae bacterium]